MEERSISPKHQRSNYDYVNRKPVVAHSDGGGIAIMTLEKLAGKAKRLIQGIQKLRHLGIEEFVLPLPKICVVGDQSSC